MFVKLSLKQTDALIVFLIFKMFIWLRNGILNFHFLTFSFLLISGYKSIG